MPKQPKTFSLELATIKIIERLATDTRRRQGAIIDLAIEAYINILNAQSVPGAKTSQLPEAISKNRESIAA